MNTTANELEKLIEDSYTALGNFAHEVLLREAHTLGKKEGIAIGFAAAREISSSPYMGMYSNYYKYETLADYEKEVGE